MCGGAELVLGLAGALGNAYSAKEQRDQQEAIAAAQNQRLNSFLDRNNQRKRDADAAFASRKETITPEAQDQIQGDATTNRQAQFETATEGTRGAPTPIRGSAPSVVSDIFRTEENRAVDRSKERSDALAKTGGVGDMLFQNNLANQNTGRELGFISGRARDDSSTLGIQQDLAGASAAAANQPGLWGPVLSGAANFAGSYYGSKKPRVIS